jgi:2-keto-4-pentenoate hydratase/2-oxohepta-3-ene-1,7-dioic acid hydratase in catechol pathway
MKLVMIDCVPGGRPGAILASGEILHLERAAVSGSAEAWLPRTLKDILRAGNDGLMIVRGIVSRVEGMSGDERAGLHHRAILPSTTPLLAPLPDPRLFVSAGHAYRSHVDEMKSKAPATPQGFLKAPGTIVGPRDDIRLPPQCPDRVDFEGEICAVIGRHCHNVTPDRAMDCIAGYTITNDVSARDWVPEIAKARTTPEARAAWDLNHMGKQLPGFSPLGPALVTADEVDPVRLELTTRLNGEVMQNAVTSDLIFTVAESLAFFSRWYEFTPGDILSTGTPAGVGFGRNPQVFIKPGDIVEVEVSGLGKISNRFVAG